MDQLHRAPGYRLASTGTTTARSSAATPEATMIRPDTDELIAFLNSLLEVDRGAISTLMLQRKVVCKQALLDHSTVQCGPEGVGMLGILNGYCGTLDEGEHAGWGPISAVADKRTCLIRRFERTT